MNKRQKSSIIVASLAAIAVTGSLVAGATYALFTSESKTNIAVTSGKVSVVASINSDSLVTYSGEVDSLTGNVAADADHIKATTTLGKQNGEFLNGGTASLDANGDLVLNEVTPGDKVDFTINVTNSSNVAVKYRTIIKCATDDGLFTGLKFTIGNQIFSGRTSKSSWTTLTANAAVSQSTLNCTVDLPSDAGDEYQGKSCTISYTVEAVQGNAATSDTDENTIEVYTVSDLKWVQKHVSEIDTTDTVELMNDLDLAGENWTPIGNDIAKPFVAKFEGNGYTIKNLTSTQYTYQRQTNCGYGTGLFAYVENATIQNLVIEDANVGGATAYNEDSVSIYSEVGIVAGCSKGNSIFNKITVKNSTVKAQTKVGAILGQSVTAGSTTKITDCTITNVAVYGNYSYAIVCGLVNNKTSTIDFTGTTVNTDSKAIFWTSDACEFKGENSTNTNPIYTDEWGSDTYKWEKVSGSYWIIEVANAWSVQRGSGSTVTNEVGESGTLKEAIIYIDSVLSRNFENRN